MLEGATKHRLKPSVRACVLFLTAEITASQQAELDEAKRTHRPILIIRGIPLEIDPALSAVVDVSGEAQVAQGPIYAKVPMREWR